MEFGREAARLCALWGVTLGERLPGATCSDVFAGIDRLGREVVLKLPTPHSEERNSIAALRSFAEVGGVAVFEHDSETGATLQRRIRPGTNLLASPEEDAIAVCASSIRRIRAGQERECLRHGVRLETWFGSLLRSDRKEAAEARGLVERLLTTTVDPVLLHGDLHHENILRDGSGWTFIDPKGIGGDRSFEITAFMRNPLSEHLGVDRLARRIVRFAAILGDPVDRLWGWAYGEAVLDWIWSIEEGSDPTRNLARAKALRRCAGKLGLSGPKIS